MYEIIFDESTIKFLEKLPEKESKRTFAEFITSLSSFKFPKYIVQKPYLLYNLFLISSKDLKTLFVFPHFELDHRKNIFGALGTKNSIGRTNIFFLERKNKMEGTVKWYNFKKGYGFIQGEDNEDYFVHFTAIAEGVSLRENDKVSFDPTENEKGKQASNVQLLQKASERTDIPPKDEEPAEKGADEETLEEGETEAEVQEDAEENAEETDVQEDIMKANGEE